MKHFLCFIHRFWSQHLLNSWLFWQQEQPLFYFKQWIAEFCRLLSTIYSYIYVCIYYIILGSIDVYVSLLEARIQMKMVETFKLFSFQQNFFCQFKSSKFWLSYQRCSAFSSENKYKKKTINENVNVKFKNPQSSRLCVCTYVHFKHIQKK